MNKVKKILAAALLSSSLFLSGCNHGSNNDGKEQVYVLPTALGNKYLSSHLAPRHKGIQIKKANGDDEGYQMVIDESALEGASNVKFNTTGTQYESNDIDVMLFGIGTNFNNTADSSTLLYASLDDTGTTDAEKSIVTGVEYAYGTGPIKNELNTKQQLWLKTTVMEKKGDVYVANPSTDIKFTPVTIQLVDTSAPILSDIGTLDIPYGMYVEGLSHFESVDAYIKDALKASAHSFNYGIIDGTDKAALGQVEYDSPLPEEIFPNESVSGRFTVVDAAGNESKWATFKIKISKDFDTETVSEIPYRKLTGTKAFKVESKNFEVSDDEKKSVLKDAVLEHFAKDSVKKDDIEIKNFDDICGKLQNLKENLWKELDVVASIKTRKFSRDNLDFNFKFTLTDIYALDRNSIEYTVKRPDLIMYENAKTIDDVKNNFFKTFVSVKDDYEDTYYITFVNFIYVDDDGDETPILEIYISDSTQYKNNVFNSNINKLFTSAGYILTDEFKAAIREASKDKRCKYYSTYSLQGEFLESKEVKK